MAPRRQRILVGIGVSTVAAAGWTLLLVRVTPSTSDGAILAVALLIGPSWAYAFCLASGDDDFPGDAWRDRDGWLRLLPLTFVLAPVVPAVIALLVQFFRDSRADHGQTWLGSGRSRPHSDEADVR